MQLPSDAGYEGELASSILLEEDAHAPSRPGPGLPDPLRNPLLEPCPPFFTSGLGGLDESRGRAPYQRIESEAPHRTPTRTPSPVYQYGGGVINSFGEPDGIGLPPAKSAPAPLGTPQRIPDSAGSAPAAPGAGGPTGSSSGFSSYAPMQTLWQGLNQPPPYYNMLVSPAAPGQPAAAARTTEISSKSGAQVPVDANVLSMMMMAQQQQATQPGGACCEIPHVVRWLAQKCLDGNLAKPERPERESKENVLSPSQALPPGPQPPRPQAVDKKAKARRDKEPKHAPQPQQHEPGAIAPGSASLNRASDKGGPRSAACISLQLLEVERVTDGDGVLGKSRQGTPSAAGDGMANKLRPQATSPLIEHLKARERLVDLAELSGHISEIAQDQYGSRLIQQKLEVASDEQKQIAFKQVLQKMSQLTTDVFGNYVIQKFFEYGNSEQRRILAEQLVGQVLKLSLQMYGCRVVQKALDSVPIEQQVLLIGELKGHVIKCIEDQHGNHVIQKCIERLPTDRIGFIVDSFAGQAARMAKHCYGCRVIQRLIEYCASAQISALLDEVLGCCMELATDQYGNYVVQHVMEHSSRPGDRQQVMNIVRKNILSLSCHKYASNVIEKALQCATPEERSHLVEAITGQQGDPHPPLLVMMRDRFGNYIVQRVIALAQSPQRDLLFWKLREHMPVLKKSNTYGKHIISALERAQTSPKD
ncbi:Pum2 [Symbiodinium sp. CCMP2592]|nr:Pum2 [Symbiodinium sp. CCMP2592]